MSALVVILAPRGPMGQVREVLRDLSAVGLIEPFVWVEPADAAVARVPAMSVTGGATTGTTLQDVAVANIADRVRLISLVPVLTGAAQTSSDDEQRIAGLLENQVGAATLARIRVSVTRIGDPSTGVLGRAGWHNLLLAPQESAGPALGHSLLAATNDTIEIGRHTAVELAGIAGLWSQVTGSPLDGRSVDPGESVRLARSFFRRLQSDGLESELRAKVTATSESLPLPVEGGSAAIYVDDSALATSTMSKALWERHGDVLRGPRESRPRRTVKPIGIGKALKMFFGFLWAAIKGAPAKWFSGVVAGLSSRVAGAVHGMVFGGDPSAYAVVVRGVTASGLPASWLDLADAADAIEDILEESGEAREHHAISDLSALWKDYAAGALTLADGGERVQSMPPVQIGTQRAVLRSADLVVPSAAARFINIPGHIAAQIEVSSVEAFDVLAVNNLHQRLVYLQEDPALGLEVGGTLEALKVWNAQHRNSFAARVASVLGEHVMRIGEEIKSVLEKLKSAAAAEDIPAAIAARQKRLGRVLRILSILLVVAGALIGACFGFGLITGTLALILAGSSLLAWFVASIVTFLRGQRDLFRLLNARQELIADAEIMKRNLRQAVRDMRRLTDAYAQFLAWSRILGTMLAAPLGAANVGIEDGARLSPDLPIGVRLGSASVPDAALADAVVALRREIFRVGWLGEPWESLITGAPAAIGPDGYELRNNPIAIFAQPGRGDTSLLLKWVDATERNGVDVAVADRLWTTVQEQLDGDKRELASALLGSIIELGKTAKAAVPYDTFIARVDDPDGVKASSHFDPAVFAEAARASADAGVDVSWGENAHVGLSRIAVLTQLSAGSPAYQFAANGADGATDSEESTASDLTDLTF